MNEEFSLFIVASVIFQIWMCIDCLKRKEKYFWILIILLFGPIGAAMYLFFVKLSGNKIKIKFKYTGSGLITKRGSELKGQCTA